MSDEWRVPGFTAVRELGRGGGGTVVAATDDAGTPVAIKYLSDELLADDGFRTAFRTEAELLAGLDSPHVARLFEYVEGTRGAAIVMELVDGTSLRTTLTEHGPTEPESALSVLKGSLLGLGAAHRAGVVHRDYKPENVLVTADGDSKLVDFGIAARSGGAGDGAGTPAYMPPEQWAGGPASTQGDIYSATATFVEALTGHPPYLAADFATLRDLHEHAPVPVDELPGPVRDLARNGLAKNPAERPLDAQDFLVALEDAAVNGYGPDWEERGRDRLARRAALLALLSAETLAAAGSTAVASSLLGRLGLASRRPASAAAVGLVLAAGLAAVAVTSGPHTGVPGIGQTTFPQRVAVQPGDIFSGSAPVGTPNPPVPAGPSNSGEPGVSPPARGESAGEAGGDGAPPRVIVLPSPPARVYRPDPPEIHSHPEHPGGHRRPPPDGGVETPGEPKPLPPPIDPPPIVLPPHPIDPPIVLPPPPYPEPEPPHPPIDPKPPYPEPGPPHPPIDPPPIVIKPPHPIDPKPPGPGPDSPPPIETGPKPSDPDGGADTPSGETPKPPILRDRPDRDATDTGAPTLPRHPRGTNKDKDNSSDRSVKRPHHPTGDGERGGAAGRHPRYPRGENGRGSGSEDSSPERDAGSSSDDDGGSHDSDNKGSDDSGPVIK
jgi:serine/threonine-protein kinase